MAYFNKDLVIPKTVSDMVDVRDRVIELLTKSHDNIVAADTAMEEIFRFGLPSCCTRNKSLADQTKEIDSMFWREAFQKTGFMQLMDEQARNEFQNSLDKDPPFFSIENIRSIFATLAQDAETMFKRGIVNCFRYLSSHHKTNTNEPFKINNKAIMTWMFEFTGKGLRVKDGTYAYSQGHLNDIDRVIKTLDGKKHQAQSLQYALNKHFLNDYTEPYEDEYYRIKGFKKGTMHIEFKRQDLLDKVNKLIAEHYGENKLAH